MPGPKMKHFRKTTLRFALALLPLMLLMACATNNQTKTLDLALTAYEKAIRWSEWDLAMDHLAPDYLAENPVSPLDADRLRLFRVTQYNVRSSQPYDAGMGYEQTVEIRLFNKNRAVERILVDRQDWRYDVELEHWFLHTGLPDVRRAR